MIRFDLVIFSKICLFPFPDLLSLPKMFFFIKSANELVNNMQASKLHTIPYNNNITVFKSSMILVGVFWVAGLHGISKLHLPRVFFRYRCFFSHNLFNLFCWGERLANVFGWESKFTNDQPETTI